MMEQADKKETNKYKIIDIEFNKRSFLLKTQSFSFENLHKVGCDRCEQAVKKPSKCSIDQFERSLDNEMLSSSEYLFSKSSVKLKKAYLKNLMVLSSGFMLVFSAFFSLRNLQTSLNKHQSLGLLSLACMNGTFALGCILANSIIQKVRPKQVMTFMLFGNLLYVASNFYPSFFTLVPATLILGFTMANLLVSQSTYLTSIAVSHASASLKPPDYIISLFNGFFLFMMYLAHFFGNLISSVVFYAFPPIQEISTKENTTFTLMNTTTIKIQKNHLSSFPFSVLSSSETSESLRAGCGFCGESSMPTNYKFNHTYDFNIRMNQHVVYILLIVFSILSIQGQLLIALFLDRLDVIFYKSKLPLKKQVRDQLYISSII